MRNVRSLVYIMVLLMAYGCQQNHSDGFTLKGEIAEADGCTLYLDWLGINAIQTVDSVRLDSTGIFSFRQPRPESYEFYRLRIDNQVINLSADSTETISVKASKMSMGTGYEVTGSENCAVLKNLVLAQMKLQNEINDMVAKSGPETGILAQRVNEKVDIFKSDICNSYIFSCPDKPCAYYALFMRINGTPLLRPQESRQDAKCFASVATVMDLKYPDAVRTAHLHNVALKAMKATAGTAAMSEQTSEYLNSIIREAGVLEIELPDVKGVLHRLTELTGKVVLLDFTVYKAEYSASYNLVLRDLYNKYAEQGFEIFQVSFDGDGHFWATSADNLPWICVRDEAALQSDYLGSYRIETLPTAFLISRENEIVERMQDYRELESHIADLL
ncbi:MAG: thioredoxin family protein [Bacteroidaceae bacterium]|nr:thioredoxin family protein [Bacteroidaceae bacterium]